MANLPRHGDPIIERQKDPLGNEKLVASFQFQRFLDGLGESVEDAPLDLTDVTQLVESISVRNESLLTKVKSLAGHVQDSAQITHELQALVNMIDAHQKINTQNLDDSIQIIMQQAGVIDQLETQVRSMHIEFHNAEQLIHVD